MGSNALHNVYVQPIKSWGDWKETVKQLCKKNELKEKFHSIAIDTVDEAWALCVKYVCSQEGIETLKDLGWGEGWDKAKKEFATTFRDLAYSGYGLIFTSHSAEKKRTDDNDNEYEYILPALQKTAFDVVNKMVDVIGYIREVPSQEGTQKRYLFFRDTKGNRFLAKSRYKYIKPFIELNYEELVNTIYEAIDEEVKHKGGNLEASLEENPYTKLNFEELITDAKELWQDVVAKELVKEVDAILEQEFGKPTKFSEITQDQVESLYKVIYEVRSLLEQ